MTGVTTAVRGLTSVEARRLLAQWGENRVSPKKRVRPGLMFLRKFTSPLLLVLIGASLLSLFLGQRTNAIIILFMVAVSGVLDFMNSYKSERAVESLVSRVVTNVTVIRDAKPQLVALHLVVPGDLVQLEPGNIVPADGRVLTADDFFVNQSALTGEAFPVEKTPASGSVNEITSDPTHVDLVFMGTTAVTGNGTIEVTATGNRTQYGVIAERLAAIPPVTQFERGVKDFSVFIMKVTLGLVSLVFIASALLHRDLLESFIFAVAIAIGLTPELLPVIMSVSLSRGSMAMAKQQVLVKNLPAIQNLGAMDVLCTDKTGTLTEDKIVLVQYGDGFGHESEEVFNAAYINSSFHTGVANPLDTAIREHQHEDLSEYRKVDEIPFDFARRRHSVVVETGLKPVSTVGERQRLLITKGSPEDLLMVCATCRRSGETVSLDVGARAEILARLGRLSQDGLRTLGVATRPMPEDSRTVYHNREERDMEFLGFVQFLDPPKAGAAAAIVELEQLGVEVKILTGDNEQLTLKICKDMGLSVAGMLLGLEVEKLTDEQLIKQVAGTTVFARVSPIQKERIIKALRTQKRVVGYLGDGINDAPALTAADVGISVDNAVDVAREAADIILLQKNLHVLRAGVMEGRRTFQNTSKYMMMGLSSNFGNMFSMMVASVILPFLPLLPAQILLNNFLYDTSQVTLAGDHVDATSLRRPARWDLSFIRRYMVTFGLASSLFDIVTFSLLLGVFRLSGADFQAGWFLESLATQVLVIYVIRTRLLPFVQSRPSGWLIASTLLCVAAGCLVLLVPYLRQVFAFGRLTPGVVIAIGGIVLVYLVTMEFAKRAFYRRLVSRA